jgi:GNAT superfamily N-acetyltransferase
MLEIKRSSLPLSELAQSPEYIPLIDPYILTFLKQPTHVGKWVAIEARLEGKLVGLALFEVYDEGLRHTAQLYSLIVSPNHRRKGIGRQLLAFAQEVAVKEEESVSFEFVYSKEDPFAPAIDKILASLDWAPPNTLLVRCHFDAYAFDPPWIHRQYHLPPSMTFFTWTNLTPEDKKHIEYLGYHQRFLPYLNPFKDEKLIDKETSVGLRHKKQVVGWSITHRTDPSTICYRSLYVDSSLLHTGYGIQLLVESIRRHKKLPIPNAVLEANVRQIDPSWAHFIKKRLFPLTNKIEHVKHAIRIFI